MYNIKDIKHVHLEVSSLCNARCPLCPRNFYGYPYNDGYKERNLTLEDVKNIFSIDFLNQLTGIIINGNFGDMVMNPEILTIIQYFKKHNNRLTIDIHTNGGARTKKFWQNLAKTKSRVLFGLDGLEDTHSIYRQDTVFKTIIKNAQAFIEAGGHATWKFIPFDHNQHQIEECKKLSQELGFKRFQIADQGRNQGIAVNKKGQVVNIIGKPEKIDFKDLLESKKTSNVLLEDIPKVKKNIDCKVLKGKSVYITSTGEVYPCCWTGFYPRTYGHGQYYEVVNKQLNDIIKPNNALERPLVECLKWFNDIEKSWSIDKFEDGRLVICNDVCGQ